jgi:D-cysteine desulfhydrase
MLSLVHGPTPIQHFVWHGGGSPFEGIDLWIKRDDMTGGACAGNKIRKLEFLLADAIEKGKDHVITCGGIQSNHARATAILAARLGLRCTLLLRVDEGETDPDRPAPRERLPRTGNVLLDRLVGAEIRFLSHAEYKERDACLAAVASSIEGAGGKPYVIPEGGSSGRGALGYVDAMREIRAQLDLGLGGGKRFDLVVVACGSGGTAAGAAIGASTYDVATRVMAVCVCDDAETFRRVVDRITREAMSFGSFREPVPIDFDETARGPRYGVMDDAQRAFLVRVARASGLVLDPVYTGKALFGLANAVMRGAVAKGSRVLFLHTGGLPGLLAAGDAFEREL